MVFVWDEKKNRINRRKHGISFETAAQIFEDPNVVSYRGAGRQSAAPEEPHGDEEIRIIPARKASAGERDLYHSHK
jgi:uncharacterized DUF497 family protein